MQKKLILLTAGFPYGNGETFLETELKYLATAFESIHILAIGAPDTVSMRTVPENCVVESFDVPLGNWNKLKSLAQNFDPMVREELKKIQKDYSLKVSLSMRKTMLISLYRAKCIKKRIELKLSAKQSDDTWCLYSYWCDDSALSLALLRQERPEINAFSRAHGWDVYFEASTIGYLPFRQLIVAHLNRLFVISQRGKEYILAKWKVQEENKVEVARLGVEIPTACSPCAEFTVVTCSALIPLKRIDLLIEALSRIKDQNMAWVHFGDGPLRESLQQRAAHLLPESISWTFKGHFPHAELMDWYAKSTPSLFVNVSNTEGIPVSIMEAMSYGIPALATDVGGTSELVNSTNGSLLPVTFEPEELARLIVKFAQMEDVEIQRYRAAALGMISAHYNADVNYAAFASALKSYER